MGIEPERPTIRAAIYARYSTDLQSDASIEDQHRLCVRLLQSQGWAEAETYSDRGLSGSSHLRPGYQRLLEGARHNQFDVVVAEGLDRISRDQEHIAGFFKQMRFQGIPIFTVAEGEISELHIGLKGTISSLFLKDLAQKTRRGLQGRVLQGKAATGVTYGYDVVRNFDEAGNATTGERSINAEQAAIVLRIFEAFANGDSPRSIAAGLNKDGIDGPRGKGWGMSTIYGNWRRGTGILNNELYIGRMVWNRQRFIKDPNTGKRQARMNPPDQWVTKDVPELRIVPQELWDQVKTIQNSTRSQVISKGRTKSETARRPRHLFSGMVTCGCCGGGYTIVGKTYLGCANARNKGTCENKLTIRYDEVEARVLSGLKDHLLNPDLIAEFVQAYQQEYNRLTAEKRRDAAKLERDLHKTTQQIERIVDAIADGLFQPSMKAKLEALEAEKASLEDQLQAQDQEPPALLHPGLADVYRAKVANLSDALKVPETRAEASQIMRGLMSDIRMIPEDGTHSIELVGELAGLLVLGQTKTASDLYDPGVSVSVVAGARFELTTFRL